MGYSTERATKGKGIHPIYDNKGLDSSEDWKAGTDAYGIERIESLRTADRQGKKVRPKGAGASLKARLFHKPSDTRLLPLRQLRMLDLMLTTDYVLRIGLLRRISSYNKNGEK